MTIYAGTTAGSAAGVSSTSGSSIEAMRTENTDTGLALYASSTGADAINCVAGTNHSAIYALNNGGGVAVAVNAISNNTNASYGSIAAVNTSSGFAIRAESTSGTAVYGTSDQISVWGNTSGGTGVRGECSYDLGTGVVGYGGYLNTTGVFGGCSYGGTGGGISVGVLGYDGGGYAASYAGWFNGKVYIGGVLSGTGKSFKIDHPLDPANKYLVHSCVESSQRRNMYDGVGIANEAGQLRVELPEYFEALNADFRYQLTAIGGPSPNLHVRDKIAGNAFVIAGAVPGQEVAWQVTGRRIDAWAQANPFTDEEDKDPEHRGRYLQPAAHGQPESLGIGYNPRHAEMSRAANPVGTKDVDS